MKSNFLGKSGISVSPIGMGTLTLGPFQKNFPVEIGANLIVYAVRRGINVLDTADIYDTYPYIKKALEILTPQEKRNLIIISRSYDYTRVGMEERFKRACREMGVERVPIFMLHEMESELTIRGHADALDYLWERKRDGFIDLVGISTHYIKGVIAAADHPQIDCIFALLNQQGLGICDGTVQEMESALQRAHDLGKGILLMKVLGGGHLFRDARASLEYARDLPFSDCVVVGMQSTDEIDFNISIFNGTDIFNRPSTIDRTTIRPRTLLIEDYCQGCGNCLDACPFHAISMKEGKASVNHELCMLCSYCARKCPDFCIKVV